MKALLGQHSSLPTPRLLPAVLVGLLLAAAVEAQGELYNFEGAAVSRAGDADSDGRIDFAVTSDPGPAWPTGRLVVYAGSNGAQLFDYRPAAPYGWIERPECVGDVDADGHDDMAAVESKTGGVSVVVVSGATGALLARVVLPLPSQIVLAIAGVGDLDGDSRDDFAIGTTLGTPGPPAPVGEVWLISGANASVLRTIPGPAGESLFGIALDAYDDLDGDGLRDLVAGTGDRVYIVSTASGAVLFSVSSTDPGFGGTVAAIGDADGDGTSDLAIGAPSALASQIPGALNVIAVPSGVVIRRWGATLQQHWIAHAVAAVGDYDGDGLADVMYAAGVTLHGCCVMNSLSIEIASPASGAVLYQGYSDDASTLDNVGDVDGNGTVDYIAGEHYALSGSGACSVTLTGVQPPLEIFPCVSFVSPNTNSLGCAPHLAYRGAPSLTAGNEFGMHIDQLRNRVPAALLMSFSYLPQVLFGQNSCLGSPRRFIAHANSGGSVAGNDCTGTLDVPLPKQMMSTLGWSAGSIVSLQGWSRDPGFTPHHGISLSDAIFLSVWP